MRQAKTEGRTEENSNVKKRKRKKEKKKKKRKKKRKKEKGGPGLAVFSITGPMEAATTPKTCKARATRFLFVSIKRFLRAEMKGGNPLGRTCRKK